MIGFALALALQGSLSSAPVNVAHFWKKGAKLNYKVASEINAEYRQGGLETWIPAQTFIDYQFSLLVEDVKDEGIAVVRYRMPQITETIGETFDRPPVAKTEKVETDMRVTLSPTNEILEQQDIKKETKAKADEKGKKKGGKGLFLLNQQDDQDDGPRSISGYLASFVSNVHQMCLYIGPAGVDLSPKLPFTATKLEGTWSTTAGYSPRALSGSTKMAVQRMDLKNVFKGLVQSNGKKVLRVEADMNLDTDLATYFEQISGIPAARSGLKAYPLKAKLHIDYDLDPVTKDTLRAVLTSEGGMKILTTMSPTPVTEERFRGRTVLTLLSKS